MRRSTSDAFCARTSQGLRDELIISTKAGWDMWPGPYGFLGSRKYLMASLDQSLQRLGVDYVDIFYSHRADPETPLEETVGALASAVHQGKALYAGISSSPLPHPACSRDASRHGGPATDPSAVVLDAQPLDRGRTARHVGRGRLRVHRLQSTCAGHADQEVPPWHSGGSRASRDASLDRAWLTEEYVASIRALQEIADARGQSIAQMAVAWTLRDPRVTSTLIGASSVEQLLDTAAAVRNLEFSHQELAAIDEHR